MNNLLENKELEKAINEFEESVKTNFNYLEKMFNYKRMVLEKIDFDSYRDKHVEIAYIGSKVAIKIFWYIIDASLGVIMIELKDGKIPDKTTLFPNKGNGRAIGLDFLILFKTNEEVKPLLPYEIGKNISTRKISVLWQKRSELILKDMKGLIKNYAQRLERYGNDIINGDTRIFSEIQKYYEEKTKDEMGR